MIRWMGMLRYLPCPRCKRVGLWCVCRPSPDASVTTTGSLEDSKDAPSKPASVISDANPGGGD